MPLWRPQGRGHGLADLHFHQWDEYNFGGAWLEGQAQGRAETALGACKLKGHRGAIGLFGRNRGPALFVGLPPALHASDDRGCHLTGGISDHERVPHWAGWPTSDSIAHQQAWEGWVRLAHEGLPMVHYLQTVVLQGETVKPEWREAQMRLTGLPAFTGAPGGQARGDWVDAHVVELAVREFRDPERYATNMEQAWKAGYVGLNLAISSAINYRGLCDVLKTANYHAPIEDLGEIPAVPHDDYRTCLDMPNVLGQLRVARRWANENADWVALVDTPEQARNAIEQGKLALVMSIEASDLFEYPEPAATAPATPVAASNRTLSAQLDEAIGLGLRSLQVVHEVDNRFGGAAPVSELLFGTFQGYFEEAYFRGVHVDNRSSGCRKDQICPFTEDYARIRFERGDQNHRRLFTGHGGPKPTRSGNGWGAGRLFSGLALLGFDLIDAPTRLLPDLNGEKPIKVNAYGLTQDGESLLRLAMKAGIPIDLAHMSHQLMLDVLDALPKNWPVYVSHSYSMAMSAKAHEDQIPDYLLDKLAARGAMFGLIDHEDPVAPARRQGSVAQLEAAYDCAGTSLSTLAMFAHIHDRAPTLGLAFGTDINGFVNHARGSARFRPTMNPEVKHLDGRGPLPCAAIAPVIGSELGRRGVAHEGLVPQTVVEMRAWVDVAATHGATKEIVDIAEDSLDRLTWSADNWLALWEQVEAVREGGDTVPPFRWEPPPPLPRPDFSNLAELPVTTQMGSATYTVQLPLLRAVEGVLPYVYRDSFKADNTAIPVYPQIHPTVAWQFGAESYPAYDLERVPATPQQTWNHIGVGPVMKKILASFHPPGAWAGAINREEDRVVTAAAKGCAEEVRACLAAPSCAGASPIDPSSPAPADATSAWRDLQTCTGLAMAP